MSSLFFARVGQGLLRLGGVFRGFSLWGVVLDGSRVGFVTGARAGGLVGGSRVSSSGQGVGWRGFGVALASLLVVAGCSSPSRQSSVDLFPSSSVSASPSVVGGPTPMPVGVTVEVTYDKLGKSLSPDQVAVVELMQKYHDIFYGMYNDDSALDDFPTVASPAELAAAKSTLSKFKEKDSLLVGRVSVDISKVTLTNPTGTVRLCREMSGLHGYKKGSPITYIGAGRNPLAFLARVEKRKNVWIVSSLVQFPDCNF